MDFIFVISAVKQIHLIVLSRVSYTTDFIFECLKLQVDTGSVTIIECISSCLCCQFPHSTQYTADVIQSAFCRLNQVIGLLGILRGLFHSPYLVGHSSTDSRTCRIIGGFVDAQSRGESLQSIIEAKLCLSQISVG